MIRIHPNFTTGRKLFNYIIPTSCNISQNSRFKSDSITTESEPLQAASITNKFNVVFSLPFIRYFAVFNRLKLYNIIGSAAIVPSAFALESMNIAPQSTFLSALYISITSGAVLSMFSLPFRNTIGFIYISDDNKLIKISYLDYWGRRKERTLAVEDWTPLSDLPKKNTDILYLTPTLSDGSRYKLFVKFGNIYSPEKMSYILE